MSVKMQKIAELAGVTRQAVSAVMNHPGECRISVPMQEKIRRIAAELGYIPNAAARMLKGVSPRMIGLVGEFPYFGTHPSLFREFTARLREKKYDITVRFSKTCLEKSELARIVRELEMKGMDAVVVMSDTLADLSVCSLPHLLLGSRDYDVGCSRRQGMYLAASHLFGHGRKRVGFVHIRSNALPERLAGWRQACIEHTGGPLDELEICADRCGNDTGSIIRRIRELKLDAVCTQNDFVAGRLIHSLLRRGIRVPDDVAVIGFDGLSFCDFCAVPLATVAVPVCEQARLGVDLLMERIRNKTLHARPVRIEVPPMVYGNVSCGCPEHPDDKFYTVNTFQSLELDQLENYGHDLFARD